MAKCSKCSKLVSKKTPGLQCGKCSKWSHAACASLSNEQLPTLSATDAVDWKCKSCASQSKTKRLSAILPEPEDDDNTDTDSVLVNQECEKKTILSEIRNEIRKVIREELQNSLKFYAEKIDDFQESIDNYEHKIKNIENQNQDLKNKFTNIQLKYEVLEQKLNSLEQIMIENKIEICGINKSQNENIENICKKISVKLGQSENDIIKIYRKESKAPAAQNRISTTLVVSLKEAGRFEDYNHYQK